MHANTDGEQFPRHCSPSDYAAMIVKLQRIESGELRVGDQDWRTQSGVLWRMLHYATRCTDQSVDMFLAEFARRERSAQSPRDVQDAHLRTWGGGGQVMAQQTIAIDWYGGHKNVVADVEGHFAIHEAEITDDRGDWVVTHVPTGRMCVLTSTRLSALAARAEFMASGLDWSFTNPKALTADHKRVGKAIKQKYEGQ